VAIVSPVAGSRRQTLTVFAASSVTRRWGRRRPRVPLRASPSDLDLPRQFQTVVGAERPDHVVAGRLGAVLEVSHDSGRGHDWPTGHLDVWYLPSLRTAVEIDGGEVGGVFGVAGADHREAFTGGHLASPVLHVLSVVDLPDPLERP